MWLDELQRYLDGEHGLTGGVVRALLNAPHPAVIIGTLWPDRYTAYTTLPAPGGADPHAREREVLDLAAVIRIDPAFSPAEQDRARAAAARDPRLRVALEAAGYGLTQTLAAAPQLVARWEDAKTASPYAWAVLTAALDAARLGARAPLSADLLRAAAPGYCTSQQQAEAPDNWFEQALAYATGKLHGAAAALSPAGAGMGQVAGYTAADYLIQHASRERRYARVPASTWDAVLSHIRDPADAARLADSARSRLLYRYAIPLYRHAADAGDGDAAGRLAELLAERGDLDGAEQILRARADAGDGDAAWRLAELLAERGDLDGAEQICAPGPTPATRTPPGGWPGCWPSAATWTGCAPGPTPATGMPPGGWPSCWPSAATWTGCAPGPTPATGTPPGGWPSCWPSAATWTRPRRYCAPGPTPATGTPPGGWPTCWPSAATWTGPTDPARPGRRRRRGRRLAAGRAAGRARRPGRAARPGRRRRRVRRRRLAGLLAERGDLDGAGRSCAPGPTPATGTPPGGWPSCWPSAATWTGCAPGPTPATGTPPGGWPSCWPSAATWTGCAPGPTPATGTPPGGWPTCWPSAATWTGRRSARPGRRRRRGRRRAAGRPAGRARRPGRAARPGRRRRRGGRPDRWPSLLTKQGRGEEAERLRRFGLNPDGSIACAKAPRGRRRRGALRMFRR